MGEIIKMLFSYVGFLPVDLKHQDQCNDNYNKESLFSVGWQNKGAYQTMLTGGFGRRRKSFRHNGSSATERTHDLIGHPFCGRICHSIFHGFPLSHSVDFDELLWRDDKFTGSMA
jgi:hypothetical protein